MEPGTRRRVHLFFAVLFYGFIAAAGLIWIHYTLPVKIGALFSIRDAAMTFGLGIGAGLAIAGLTRVVVWVFTFARSLEREFGWLLGNQSLGEIAVLALLSGIAEEICFRGALQQALGLTVSTIVFAFAHP